MIPKPYYSSLILVSWLCLGIYAGAEESGRSSVGDVEKVQNLVEASYAGQTRRLVHGADVLLHDILKTGVDARLKVLLDDGSNLIMGASAELTVDEFVYTPDSSKTIKLNMLQGALLFVGKRMQGATRQDVEVKTPVAILGVRGTRFWVGRIDGDTGVLVLDGEVAVSNRHGRLTLGPGEGTMIKDDGSFSPPKTWGEKKKARALGMVEFR